MTKRETSIKIEALFAEHQRLVNRLIYGGMAKSEIEPIRARLAEIEAETETLCNSSFRLRHREGKTFPAANHLACCCVAAK